MIRQEHKSKNSRARMLAAPSGPRHASQQGNAILITLMASLFVGGGVVVMTNNTIRLNKFAKKVESKEKTETSHGSAISVFRNLLRPERFYSECTGPSSKGCPYLVSDSMKCGDFELRGYREPAENSSWQMDQVSQEVKLMVPSPSGQAAGSFSASDSDLLKKFPGTPIVIKVGEAGCSDGMVSSLELAVAGGGSVSRYLYEMDEFSTVKPKCEIEVTQTNAASVTAKFHVQGAFNQGFYYQVSPRPPVLVKNSNYLTVEPQTYTAIIPRPASTSILRAGFTGGLDFNCTATIGPEGDGGVIEDGDCVVKVSKTQIRPGECVDVTLITNGESGTPTLDGRVGVSSYRECPRAEGRMLIQATMAQAGSVVKCRTALLVVGNSQNCGGTRFGSDASGPYTLTPKPAGACSGCSGCCYQKTYNSGGSRNVCGT